MMRRALPGYLLTLVLCLIPALAAAQTPDESAAAEADGAGTWLMRPTLGARIGGYGFREVNERGNLDWFACRMDGVGAFGTLELTRRFYVELSLDMYHAISEPIREGLDRLSLHSVAAVGVRLAPDFIISPFIQLGGGVEWTRVEVFGERDSQLFPVGFLGVGGELNLDPVMLGLTVRANAMQLPLYAWDAGETERSISYETEVAGQVLFSLRYAL
jgi:hypothetical protein